MAVRKPGPGSSQAQISAYVKQEIAKKMEKMAPKKDPMIVASQSAKKKAAVKKASAEGPKRSVAKKTAPASKAAKGGRGKSKPAPKLY
jgi:hypothetical protein